VLTLGAMGLLLNISRRRKENDGSEAVGESAAMRWRNGGRNLPRSGYGTGDPAIGS
jgi:hypothetical protein